MKNFIGQDNSSQKKKIEEIAGSNVSMKGKQNEYVLMQFEMGTPKKLPPIAGVASYMFASSTQKKMFASNHQ